MKFPLNVIKDAQSSGKVSTGEKIVFIVFIVVLANLAVYYQVGPILEGLGLPNTVLLILQLLITIIACVGAFRFFVIKEEDKMKEYYNSSNSSLSDFYFIVDKENVDKTDFIPIFEYNDGNFMVLINLKYGSSSKYLMENTRILFQELFSNCCKLGLEFRTYNMPENFKDSIECSRFLENVSNIKDENTSLIMRDISSYILEETDKYMGVMETYIQIKTSYLYQVRDINILINKLLESYSSLPNSIRYIDFLNKNSLRNFLRNYYCLEALDLSSLKTVDVDSYFISKSKKNLNICELELSSGKIERKIDVKSFLKNNAIERTNSRD